MRKLLAALLAASAVALLVVGLAAATGPASKKAASHASRTGATQAAAKGTVSMALIGDPGKLDPQQTAGAGAQQVAEFSYDTLVHQLPGGKFVSGLATKWKVLSLTKVRFTLHSGVTCTDGTKMTASVVKRNLDYIANKANGSPLLGLYVPQDTTTVANNKKRQVTVTFPSADPFPLQGLGSVHMVCSKGIANRSRLLNGADGSGPYKLVKASPGAKYTFALRKAYKWGPNGATSKGMPAKVVLQVVTSETTAANELLTSQLNIATVTGPDRTRLEKAKLFKKVVVAEPGEIWFNENNGHATASASVRRGIVQTLQLGQLGKVFTSGDGVPMKQLTLQTFTPCSGNSVKGNVPKHNAAAASSALSGHPSLKLLYANDGGPGSGAAMTLAQQELDAAGANASLDGTTTPNLLGTLFGSGNWDVALVPLGVSAPTQLVPFLSGPAPAGNGDNFAGIANATYGSQVASALKSTGATSCGHWLKAEGAIFKHADLAPTYWSTLPTFGKGVKFGLGDQGIAPTTLRLSKNKKK
jgi:peptide/nickel transport system substrate-binding protein